MSISYSLKRENTKVEGGDTFRRTPMGSPEVHLKDSSYFIRGEQHETVGTPPLPASRNIHFPPFPSFVIVPHALIPPIRLQFQSIMLAILWCCCRPYEYKSHRLC
ncbi:unnamed protein product [Dicrocoelium dendriticum]|nr:unnamed protein product [Dicrocoelium dendriticum]